MQLLYKSKTIPLTVSISHTWKKTQGHQTRIDMVYKGERRTEFWELPFSSHFLSKADMSRSGSFLDGFMQWLVEKGCAPDPAFDAACNEMSARWENMALGASVTPAEILASTKKIISYGPASGLDVYLDYQSPFRLKDDDFVNPKNFQIWFAATHKKHAEFSSATDWKSLVDEWMASAEDKTADQDPLVPDVIGMICDKVKGCRVYDGFSEEAVEGLLMKSNIFFLRNRRLLVTAKSYASILDECGTSTRKMRQFVSPFLKKRDSLPLQVKDAEGKRHSIRFWVFDWDALCEHRSDLADKAIIQVDQQLDQDTAVWDAEDCAVPDATGAVIVTPAGGDSTTYVFHPSVTKSVQIGDQTHLLRPGEAELFPRSVAEELEKLGLGKMGMV